jgi:hypothetical protein
MTTLALPSKPFNHWHLGLATQKEASRQIDSENNSISMSLLHLMSDSDGKPTSYASYIKEVFQYVSEQGISLSLAIQVVSLIASIPNLEKRNLHIYDLEDGGLVLDFFLDTDRVSCVMREQYAHIMGMLGGELKEDILQGTDYSIEQVSSSLQQLLNAVFKIQNKKFKGWAPIKVSDLRKIKVSDSNLPNLNKLEIRPTPTAEPDNPYHADLSREGFREKISAERLAYQLAYYASLSDLVLAARDDAKSD